MDHRDSRNLTPMTSILITGGAGFIGSHLTRHLLQTREAIRITLVDNMQRARMDQDLQTLLADPRVTLKQLDLTDWASYVALGGPYDEIYHLAAVNGTDLFYKIPHEVLRINTLSIHFILDWMRQYSPNGKLCFTSSNEAYAGALESFGQLPIPTPEAVPLVISDPYNPRWTYAASKLIGELFCIHYAASHNLRAFIVRPHNFYGPRAGYNHVIPQFSERIHKRVEPFAIFGSEETRTFCYIDDAVRAMALLMASDATDTRPIRTFHIGDEEEITMLDLAKRMCAIEGWTPATFDVKEAPSGSVKRRRAAIDAIKEAVGWTPTTSLDDGLRKTMEWYRAFPKL